MISLHTAVKIAFVIYLLFAHTYNFFHQIIFYNYTISGNNSNHYSLCCICPC